MLYASSRAALTRALGDERFSTSVFATNKVSLGLLHLSSYLTSRMAVLTPRRARSQADLTHSSYLSHLSHLSSEAPLTQREQEMEEIRKAEAKEQREGLGAGSNGAGRSMLVPAAGGASVGLGWSEEAKNAVEELKEREGGVVQLVSLGVLVEGGEKERKLTSALAIRRKSRRRRSCFPRSNPVPFRYPLLRRPTPSTTTLPALVSSSLGSVLGA